MNRAHREWHRRLAIAGGDFVFGSDGDTLSALDAKEDDWLWSAEAAGAINAAPMTYAVNGE
jgi:hypothetical protein